MSPTVTSGNDEPYGRPLAGSIEAGPVEPRQLPMMFEQMTKYLRVSNALPGPIIPSHQPSPPRGRIPFSSAPTPSTALGAFGSALQPAACASPDNAWSARIALPPSAASSPYVS